MAAAPVLGRSGWSWALYEWARNPYVILCGVYVLAPYMSGVVIGDPVAGQTIISSWHKTAGMIVALTAPFIGAATDAMGRRKPFLAAVTIALALLIAAQWWALPEGRGWPLPTLGLIVTAAGVCFAWTEVLHNSMLVTAAPPALLSRASGMALALGNAASVLLLLAVLWALALPGNVDWAFLPNAPLFGLDPATHQPSRVVALICAGWLLAFAAPLFLYASDLQTSGAKFAASMGEGVLRVVRTLSKLREHRNVALFLLARMFYADGKTAILIISGVYAAGVMGWGLIEMLGYGVVLSVFAVAGGFASSGLDASLGAKRAVVVEVAAVLLCLIGMVSVSAERVFFVVPVSQARLWDFPLFGTVSELAYLGFSILIAIAITAAYASSRVLLAQLAPRGMAGELFGLYALSASATAWLAPLLVQVFTSAYHSQRAGFSSIAILLVLGGGLLLFVKPPNVEARS